MKSLKNYYYDLYLYYLKDALNSKYDLYVRIESMRQALAFKRKADKYGK